jgi:hypothetical protein
MNLEELRAHSKVKREVSHFPSHQLIPCPTCGAVYEAYYMKRHLKTHRCSRTTSNGFRVKTSDGLSPL